MIRPSPLPERQAPRRSVVRHHHFESNVDVVGEHPRLGAVVLSTDPPDVDRRCAQVEVAPDQDGRRVTACFRNRAHRRLSTVGGELAMDEESAGLEVEIPRRARAFQVAFAGLNGDGVFDVIGRSLSPAGGSSGSFFGVTVEATNPVEALDRADLASRSAGPPAYLREVAWLARVQIGADSVEFRTLRIEPFESYQIVVNLWNDAWEVDGPPARCTAIEREVGGWAQVATTTVPKGCFHAPREPGLLELNLVSILADEALVHGTAFSSLGCDPRAPAGQVAGGPG